MTRQITQLLLCVIVASLLFSSHLANADTLIFMPVYKDSIRLSAGDMKIEHFMIKPNHKYAVEVKPAVDLALYGGRGGEIEGEIEIIQAGYAFTGTANIIFKKVETPDSGSEQVNSYTFVAKEKKAGMPPIAHIVIQGKSGLGWVLITVRDTGEAFIPRPMPTPTPMPAPSP